jgi:hypothetical protein
VAFFSARFQLAVGFVSAFGVALACGTGGAGEPDVRAIDGPDATTTQPPPPPAGDGSTDDAGAGARVLFIGNSYTYVNDLPGVMARLGGFVVDSHTPGGQTWEGHDADPAVTALIAKGWDYVVLQDQSDQPWGNGVKQSLLSLDAKIKASGGKTVLYMTWSKRYDGGTEETRFTQDMMVSLFYERNAVAAGARVAPVGRAWERAQRGSEPPIELRLSDGSHPTEAGTYLAACVFYETLTGKSPIGLGDGGLHVDAALAAHLQAIAAEAIRARVPAAAPFVGRWPLSNAPDGNDLVASDAIRFGDAVGPKGGATTFDKGKFAAVPWFAGIDVPHVTVSLYASKDDWSTAATPSEYLVGKAGGYEIHRDGTSLVADVHTMNGTPAPITYEAAGLAPGFHHVGLTYDGTTYALWVDKAIVASAATSGGLVYTPAPDAGGDGYGTGIALGGAPDTSGASIQLGTTNWAFAGKLSDFHVYDHAFTAAEMQNE